MWTRLLSSVYALALLELKLRIHINIVARHYLHETSAAAAAGAAGGGGGSGGGGGGSGELSKVTKLRFLSSEPLCTDGFEPLVRAVRAAVETELAGVSLDQKLTTEQLAGAAGEPTTAPPRRRTAAPPHRRTTAPPHRRTTSHPAPRLRARHPPAPLLGRRRCAVEHTRPPRERACRGQPRRCHLCFDGAPPPCADSASSLRAHGFARLPPDVSSRAPPSLPPSFPPRGALPLPHQVRAFLLEGLEDLEAHEAEHEAAAEPELSQLGGLHAEVREILQSAPYHVMLADVLAAAHGALHTLLRQKLDGGAAEGAAEGAGALPAGTPVAKLLPRMAKLLPTITAEDLRANPISVAIEKVRGRGEACSMGGCALR